MNRGGTICRVGLQPGWNGMRNSITSIEVRKEGVVVYGINAVLRSREMTMVDLPTSDKWRMLSSV